MNCKPGDMAIVIEDAGADALGLIVDVLFRSDRPDGTPAWIVEFQEGWICELRNGIRLDHRKARVPDEWLRPVSGLPVEEEMKDEVPA